MAYVHRPPERGNNIAFIGRRWNMVSHAGEIVLNSIPESAGEVPFRYPPSAQPVSRNFAEHIKRGLGFGPEDAPLLLGPKNYVWFHFGGSLIETVLKGLLPGLKVIRGLKGIALQGIPDQPILRSIAADPSQFRGVLQEIVGGIPMPSALGRYYDVLPESLKTQVNLDILDPVDLAKWLMSRELRTSEHNAEAVKRVKQALGWHETIG